jgi:hypothetical protein
MGNGTSWRLLRRLGPPVRAGLAATLCLCAGAAAAQAPDLHGGGISPFGGPAFRWVGDQPGIAATLATTVDAIPDTTRQRLSDARVQAVFMIAIADAIRAGKLNREALPFLSDRMFGQVAQFTFVSEPGTDGWCWWTVTLNTDGDRHVVFVTASEDRALWPARATACIARFAGQITDWRPPG